MLNHSPIHPLRLRLGWVGLLCVDHLIWLLCVTPSNHQLLIDSRAVFVEAWMMMIRGASFYVSCLRFVVAPDLTHIEENINIDSAV